MKKLILSVLIIFCFQFIFLEFGYSQQFTEQTNISLPSMRYSRAIWGDYDKDGDYDILITGWDIAYNYILKLYNNDNNTFVEQISFNDELREPNIIWGDYDNDGDIDILYTGRYEMPFDPWESWYVTEIYKNNGDNSFTYIFNDGLKGLDGAGNSDWGDYDNDGDLDILLTGRTNEGDFFYRNNSSLYENGGGIFSEQTDLSIAQVGEGDVSWADYDNDGDLDFLLSGIDNDRVTKITKLYKNNGDTGFSEQINVNFPGVTGSRCISWGDYNNDGYLDVLLAGDTETGKISKIYRNNGGNSFTEQTDILLEGVGSSCQVIWGDYNNDGFLDILLTGNNGTLNVSKIYKNNGGNSFTEQTDIVLKGINGSASWCDYDGDGNLDILLASGGEPTVYKNNNLIKNIKPNVLQNLQETIENWYVTFSWDQGIDDNQTGGLNYNLYVYNVDEQRYMQAPGALDNSPTENGKRLLPERGKIQSNSYRLKLPPGNYTWSVQAIDASFEGGNFAEERAFTVRGVEISPKDKQIIDSGEDGTTLDLSKNNIGNQIEWKFSKTSGGPYNSFTPKHTDNQLIPNFNLAGTYFIVCEGQLNNKSYLSNEVEIEIPIFRQISLKGRAWDAEWGDYDNDGDLDILIGYSDTSKIYKNNRPESEDFIEQTDISLPGFVHEGLMDSKATWVDYDNDGDLDIFYSISSRIFKNNGNNNFEELLNHNLPGGDACWGDYDKDGDLDVFIATSGLYQNNGNDRFDKQEDYSFPSVKWGDAEWGDYDNDGDLDLLLIGYSPSYIAKLYKNELPQSIGFTEQTDISLPGVYEGDADWGDYDNDGDLDLAITGYFQSNGTTSVESKIFKNTGDNNFIEQTDYILQGTWGEVAWADFDNDGDLDLAISGDISGNPDYKSISKLYENTGGSFVERTDIPIKGLYDGSFAWGDYDNDGDLDILTTGSQYYDQFSGNFSHPIIEIYKNNVDKTDFKPFTLSNLNETFEGNEVIFSWDTGTAPNQSNGLNYNLYIYDLNNSFYVWTPNAFLQKDSINGKRLVAERGDIQTNTYRVSLPDGEYSWSVQAIDASYEGGEFAEEQLFTVESSNNADDPGFKVYPNPVGSKFTIESTDKTYKIKIVDIKGNTTFTEIVDNQKKEIDISRYNSGIYFLYIESEKGSIVKKVVKN
jgi:hypothetical protein